MKLDQVLNKAELDQMMYDYADDDFVVEGDYLLMQFRGHYSVPEVYEKLKVLNQANTLLQARK